MRTPLLDVLPVIVRRFEGRSVLIAENLIVLHFLFVMQEFYDDMPFGITVEDYLQVGTHGQNLVHQVGNSVEETYERKQMIETGVMAKAQGAAHPLPSRREGALITIYSNHTISSLHDVLPERGCTTGRDVMIERTYAVHQSHAGVVHVIDCLDLLFRKQVPEGILQRDVLHGRSQGMEFGEQLVLFLLLRRVFVEGFGQTLTRDLAPDHRIPFQFLFLRRRVGNVVHVFLVGLLSNVQGRVQPPQLLAEGIHAGSTTRGST